ncbi:MAG: exosortase/archaeosortase family protein [Phycisphaerae bacterium]|nr:exosortase/archaeosortase family protein [Phycisphaerae bacterium]MDW8261934.1 exosortase/archaeosortase family protein [Phycisphaerales bacterium]
MSWRALIFDRITGWHLALAVLLGAAGIFVCRDAWREIFIDYASRDEEYMHLFLVPLAAIWLVWVRWMRLRHCRPSGMILGPMMVALGWFFGWYGFNKQTTSFYHFGAVLVLIGCLISVLGKNVLFRFFPAVMVLAFVVPIPGQIRQNMAVPLQNWTARASQSALDVLGVETEISGNLLFINGRAVMIEEACNGMRMVFPLLLVGFAFSFGLPLRQSVRLLILLLSPVVALACNVLRTVSLIWVQGNLTKMSPENARIVFNVLHEYGGWSMLPLAALLLLAMIRVLRWAMVPIQRYTLASQ